MAPRKIMILTALELEARAVARALGLPFVSSARPIVSHDPAMPAELHVIGLRASRLAVAFARPSEARCVLLAGLAGALDPSLAVGDLVLDDAGAPGLLGRLAPPRNVSAGPAPAGVVSSGNAPGSPTATRARTRRGVIHNAAQIVATPAEKAEVFRLTGAAAADMESGAVRAAAAERGLPLVILRAISDAAGDALDTAVLRFVDDLGRPKIFPLAAALVRRPGLIPRLRRLGAATRLATRRLEEGINALLMDLRDAPGPGARGPAGLHSS